MSTERPWPAQLTDITGAQIKRYRLLRNWTTAELAKKVDAAGLKFSRDQLVNLEREKGRRTAITVGEVIVFAAVLGVPPVLLITPVGEDVSVEYLPGRTTDPWHAYLWFTGQGASSLLIDDEDLFAPELPEVLQKLNPFQRHQDAIMSLDLHLFRRGKDPEIDPDVEARLIQSKLQQVLAIRNEIRARGWTPPLMPPLVGHEVEAAEQAERERGSRR